MAILESIGERIGRAKEVGPFSEQEERKVCSLARSYYEYRTTPPNPYIDGNSKSDREYGEIIVLLERLKKGRERISAPSQVTPVKESVTIS